MERQTENEIIYICMYVYIPCFFDYYFVSQTMMMSILERLNSKNRKKCNECMFFLFLSNHHLFDGSPLFFVFRFWNFFCGFRVLGMFIIHCCTSTGFATRCHCFIFATIGSWFCFFFEIEFFTFDLKDEILMSEWKVSLKRTFTAPPPGL